LLLFVIVDVFVVNDVVPFAVHYYYPLTAAGGGLPMSF
jgi:hypothetical protein